MGHGYRHLLFLSTAVCLLHPRADAGIINVALGGRDIYSMAGVASGDYSQSATAGTAAPLTYSGSTWNQPDGATSLSDLLDSDGSATPVGFSVTDWGDPGVADHGGSGILNLLGGELHTDAGYTGGYSSDPYAVPTVTISGLIPGFTYTLVVVSGGAEDNVNDFNIGGTAQFDSNGAATGFSGGTTLTLNDDPSVGDVWESGVNYITFTNLAAAGDGTITIQDIATVNRFATSGFQLEGTFSTPEPGSIVLAGLGLFILLLRLRRLPGKLTDMRAALDAAAG